MFENLSQRFEKAFKILKGQGSISEINIAETLKEIRRALVDADVNYKIAKDFITRVKDKAMGANVLTAVSPGQLMTKLVFDELKELLGGSQQEITLSGSPALVLIAGLQGSGKTTFSAKLARQLKAKGKKVMLVACDVYRPAAINQLIVLGEQIDVTVYADLENKNPLDIAQKAIQQARASAIQVVIVDTAGRLSVDEEMMSEIASLKNSLKPSETLFVVDAMTGQDAVNTAKAFNDRIDFNGVVLTKMDGDTRGGAALSIKTVVNKPIKYISSGEKTDTLDIFYPERMANRILGMGDVVSLVERAQQVFDEEESKRLSKKIHKNKFDLEDFYQQIQQIKKMGNIKDLMGMMPGIGNKIKDMDIDDDAFKGVEALIQSMTPTERQRPEILNNSRKQRICKGSGREVQELNKLLSQFDQMKKMMKKVSGMKGKLPI